MGRAGDDITNGHETPWRPPYDGLSDDAAAVRFSAERGIVVPVRFSAAASRALQVAAGLRGVTPSDFIRLALAEATESYLPPAAPRCPGARA